MAKEQISELNLVEEPNRVTTSDPSSTPASEPETASAKAAFHRCCAAWQRSYNAYMDEVDGNPLGSTDIFLATRAAAPAFCHAMPMLAGPDGIRDFIACAAHGMLIGAIPTEMGNQLLYAAHVAPLYFQPLPSHAKASADRQKNAQMRNLCTIPAAG